MHAMFEEDRVSKLLTAFTAGALATMTISTSAGGKMEMEMDKKGMAGMHMQMMDADGDGKISKDEFMQGHEKMFNAMDQNKDGVLDANELKMMMHQGRMTHKGMMKNKHDD
jgi:Ca2+-binding EF-hand superfamily protein